MQEYEERQRLEYQNGVGEALKKFDGSLIVVVSLLSGLSRERLEELGGVGDWGD